MAQEELETAKEEMARLEEEMKRLWRIVFDNDRAVASGIYEVLKGRK